MEILLGISLIASLILSSKTLVRILLVVGSIVIGLLLSHIDKSAFLGSCTPVVGNMFYFSNFVEAILWRGENAKLYSLRKDSYLE